MEVKNLACISRSRQRMSFNFRVIPWFPWLAFSLYDFLRVLRVSVVHIVWY